MPALQASPLRTLVTSLLVMGVSICCCQAHLITHLLAAAPDHGAERAACGAKDAGAPSCCERPGDQDQPRKTDDSAPSKCCGVCCLKWIDKDSTSLPALDAAPAPLVAAVSELWIPHAPAPPQAAPEWCGAGPPTLLRLHCALLI